MCIFFLFRNLDLESCLWTFDGYFDMSELVSQCGGTVSADGEVRLSPDDFSFKRVVPFAVMVNKLMYLNLG